MPSLARSWPKDVVTQPTPDATSSRDCARATRLFLTHQFLPRLRRCNINTKAAGSEFAADHTMPEPATSRATMFSDRLVAACLGVPERMAWLDTVPALIAQLQRRWSLTLGRPWTGDDVSCAWVAPAERVDGSRVVLKIGLPHMEAAHEADGLAFLDGEPTVRLLAADGALNAMLLERCEPGTALRDVPEHEQDVIIAGLLRRLWRRPQSPSAFRPLSDMIAQWTRETLAASDRWPDQRLVRHGLRVFDRLARETPDDVLLATDLHAGNVLRAQRAPWLVIDPKPFVGDRAYDATQHLFNCMDRLLAAPYATIANFANLLDVDRDRVAAWMFARAAAEPRAQWSDASLQLAGVLAP